MRNVLLKVAMFLIVIAVVGFTSCSKSGNGNNGGPGYNPPGETIMDSEPTNSSLSQEVRDEFEILLADSSAHIEESTYELEFTQYNDATNGGSGLTRSFNINGQSLSTKISVALIKRATGDKYYLNAAPTISGSITHTMTGSVINGNPANITLTPDGIVLTTEITENAFGSYTIEVVATLGNITITKNYEFNYVNPYEVVEQTGSINGQTYYQIKYDLRNTNDPRNMAAPLPDRFSIFEEAPYNENVSFHYSYKQFHLNFAIVENLTNKIYSMQDSQFTLTATYTYKLNDSFVNPDSQFQEMHEGVNQETVRFNIDSLTSVKLEAFVNYKGLSGKITEQNFVNPAQ